MRMAWLMRITEKVPLWKAFWIYGVLLSNLLWGVVVWMMVRGGMPDVVRGLLLVLLVYTVWVIALVWGAAPNTEDARYGVLARALTVVWAINTVLLVFFLEL